MTQAKTKKGLVPARTTGTKPKPKGIPFHVTGAKAFLDEGLPHQRRNAARDLAAALNTYADAIVT